jgi:hypothetical protein
VLEIKKEFLDKKSHVVASLTQKGRLAFEAYRREMKQVLNELPPSR